MVNGVLPAQRYEVCASIKSMPGAADVLIVFLSGRSETDAITRGFEVGAADYVTKPFHPEEILACVGSLLGQSKPKTT